LLGIGKSRFVGLAFQVCPGTYARRGSISVWSLKGLSGGVMLRSWVRCDNVVRSANRYRLRRLAGRLLGGEVTTGDVQVSVFDVCFGLATRIYVLRLVLTVCTRPRFKSKPCLVK
jgi:hypothetical protein